MSLREYGQRLETKFEHDKFLNFKIIARRNKKIGLWAARLLGVSPVESEKFINAIVSKITSDPNDNELVNILLSELKEHFITISENQLRRQMGYFYQEAKAEVAKEG